MSERTFGQRADLYHRVAENPRWSMILARLQGIKNEHLTPELAQEHYEKTAQTYEEGFKAQCIKPTDIAKPILKINTIVDKTPEPALGEPEKEGKKKIEDSFVWKQQFERKELKKQIKDELNTLQEVQHSFAKEKPRQYWEYKFDTDEQKLLPVGDVHYGARTCDVKKFKDTLAYAKKSNSAIILMGDLLENANKGSIGAGIYDQVMTPMQQLNDMYEMLLPVKDNILVMLDGNHEFRTYKDCGFCPTQIMADKLGVPYAGFEAFLKLRVKKQTYTVYATHGSTAARFSWTRAKALDDIMRGVDADIVLMGHSHDQQIHESSIKGIYDRKRIGCLTGSFLKDDPYGYTAMKNLPPIPTGVVKIKLYGDRRDLHASK